MEERANNRDAGDRARVGSAVVKRMILYVTCACGKTFASEDLEPECPYCGRRYAATIAGDPSGFRVTLTLLGRGSEVDFELDKAKELFRSRGEPVEP